MYNESVLTIKQIASKSSSRKKVLRLPILSVQTQSCNKDRTRSDKKKDKVLKEKRSLSQMLNIIEGPQRKVQNLLGLVNREKKTSKQERERKTSAVQLRADMKKYNSLENE